MAVNGSEWISQPWNTTFSPYTDFFESFLETGMGQVFWLIPIITIAFAIYVKTENPAISAMFMVASGALFSSGNIFAGNTMMGVIFTVFTILSLVGLVVSLIQREG